MANFGFSLDAAELAGAQDVARIRKRGGDADRTGLRIHLAIDEGDVPLMRKDLAVGKRESEGNREASLSRSPPPCAARCVSARYSESLIEK